MRTRYRSLLTLFEFAEIIGLHPFWMSQIDQDVPRRGSVQNITCEHVLFQDAWQGFDHLGREEIAQSISNAEDMISSILGYQPAPKYVVSEPHTYPQPLRRTYFPYIETRNGYIQAIGTELLTVIGDTSVTLTTPVLLGFQDGFTATIAVPAGTTEDEIAVFFKTADRVGLALEDCEIRPVKVSISANVATITGHITLLVKPEHQIKPNPDKLSATNVATYVTDISVYRRTTDLSDTGNLIWVKPDPCDDPPCSLELKTACFALIDDIKGWLEPVEATYNEETAQFASSDPFCRTYLPTRLRVNYLAGFPLVQRRMYYQLARIIAYLACALLPNRTAGCNRADQRLFYYRELPIDGKGNLEVPRDLYERAGKTFGVMGRGACEALVLLDHLR